MTRAVGWLSVVQQHQVVHQKHRGQQRMDTLPFIANDGMGFYVPCMALTFGVAYVHVQVIKNIKQNRVVKVGTRLVFG